MRKLINLNQNWYFKKGSLIPEELNEKEYELLNIPHTYNGIDGQDGGADYYRGDAIYVKKFERPDSEVVYIQFDGVGQIAEVYLNNELLGRHEGAYSIFRFDITDKLKDENLLVVKTNNTANETVYPQMADFTFYGGVHRDVNLICLNKEHFDLADHGSPGIIVTPYVSGELVVEAWVKGGDKFEIEVDGIKQAVDVDKEYIQTKVVLDNPHLWNGLQDPYLYTLNCKLYKDGEIKDEMDIRFGIREFKVDPEKGFILNGKEYPLRGVAKHQDWLDIGSAVTKENLDRDMELIKEVGATTVRCSHYQHNQYFYDLCDENGLVVWAEIPYISKHMPDGKDNTLVQMEELVKQNYNHPSIVCWGLSNEITIGGGAESDSLINNHKELNDLCHKLDKTRLTTMAHVMTQDTEGTVTQLPDIASYNHYYGWYVGDTSGYAKFFDKFHSDHPDYCIGLSEYGADANPKLHTDNPKRGDYTEEYQSKYHEEVLDFINQRPYLWATHLWNMFDFAADARREGGNIGKNQKGLVTMDRKTKKDSFYLYKANWNKKDKFVHLCSKRYVNRHEDETKVKVYSNLDNVALYVDDKLVEEKKGDRIFEFIIPITGKHHIEVVSGEYKDSMDIVHVAEKDESYILEDTGAMNWFDEDETDPTCFSISDTIDDLRSNPQSAAILEALMAKITQASGELASEATNNAALAATIGGMQLSTILAFGGENVTAEDIKALNDALQQIKK